MDEVVGPWNAHLMDVTINWLDGLIVTVPANSWEVRDGMLIIRQPTFVESYYPIAAIRSFSWAWTVDDGWHL